jgi:hypothetical protein
MDDQNQPNNQFGSAQPKKEEPADTTSSAPVEAEPSTSGAVPPTAPTVAQTPSQPPQATPAPSMSQTPVSPQVPVQPEEKKLEMPPQPGLLEAPKKKSGMFITLIAVVLVIALALLGLVVYQALY